MTNKNVKKTALIKLFIILILFIPAIATATMCYGVGAKDSRGVYEVDFAAGTVNLLFSTPDVGWLGATDGDADHPNTFYATSYESNILYRIDVAAHTYTPVGNYGQYRVNGLAYDDKNNVLYGTDYVNLFSIDITPGSLTEGQATLIGPLGAMGSAWAMDYDASIDELVAMSRLPNGTATYHINRTTGSASYIGTTTDLRVTDVWYDDDAEKLFAISNDPYYTGIGKLLEVDPTNGATTHIADTTENIIGLGGIPVPEPVTIVLLGLGTMTIIRTRKYKV